MTCDRCGFLWAAHGSADGWWPGWRKCPTDGSWHQQSTLAAAILAPVKDPQAA